MKTMTFERKKCISVAGMREKAAKKSRTVKDVGWQIPSGLA